jgi:hypothetical protein
LDCIDGYVICNFNLDIDNANHITTAVSNVIHKSIQALYLDDVNVEFEFICVDLGGCTKVHFEGAWCVECLQQYYELHSSSSIQQSRDE